MRLRSVPFTQRLADAPARAIQELAGHRDLSTTQRYMHLSSNAIFGAIRLLETGSPTSPSGDILETATR